MSLQSEPKSFKMIIFAILLQICSVISLDGLHLHFNKRGKWKMKNFLLHQPTKQNGTIIVQKCVNLSARRHYITIYDKSLFKWLRKFSWIYQIFRSKKESYRSRKKLLKNTHTFPYSLDVYPWGSYNPHNPGKWKFLHEQRLRHFSFIMKNYLMSSRKKETKRKGRRSKKLQRKEKKLLMILENNNVRKYSIYAM